MIISAMERKTTISEQEEHGPGILLCLNSIGKNAPLKADERIHTMAEVTIPVGFGVGKHRREKGAEIIYVLEGELYCIDNDEANLLHHGDCSYCKEGEEHEFYNRSDKPVTVLRMILN